MTAADGPVGSRPGALVDWDAARRRIAALGALLDGDSARDDREVQRVLKERAVKLARPRQAPHSAADTEEIIGFKLAHEVYGVLSDFVDEVLPLRQITPLPCVPDFVAGVINVRGRIVSVLDLKRFLELPEGGLTNLNRVMVVGDGTMEFGILADAIVGVSPFVRAQMQPVPGIFKGIRREYIGGVVSDGTIVLDAERLLTDPKLLVHDKVEAS